MCILCFCFFSFFFGVFCHPVFIELKIYNYKLCAKSVHFLLSASIHMHSPKCQAFVTADDVCMCFIQYTILHQPF